MIIEVIKNNFVYNSLSKNRGFTLIELLVVISIIGLLSTLAVISLNSARAKSRDAKRVADIKQIQTALETYYEAVGGKGYPYASGTTEFEFKTNRSLSTIPNGLVTGGGTGTIIMSQVPVAPQPGENYKYKGSGFKDIGGFWFYSSYTLTFTLEDATGGYTAGSHTATPAGIQ